MNPFYSRPQMNHSPQDRQPMSRRQWLQATVAGAAAGGACALFPRSTTAAKPDKYAGLQSKKYLGDVEVLTKIKDTKIFTEGPAVDRAGNVFFTNIPVEKILKWNPKTKQLSVFRTESGKANGLYFDPQGRLLACEGGAGRVTRTDMETGKIEVLAKGFDGKRLASPNDLCMDPKGRIYFTSRSGVEDPEGENPKGVYRIHPDGTLDRILVWPKVHMPNGIVLSPDNKTLYLIEAHPDADHHRDIRAYDLLSNGKLANERIHINFYPGRSGDGMCIDAEGNLYVAAGLHKTRDTSETLDTKPGIHVISPEGELIAYRETPEDTITNCTFGGADLRTLYITCGTLLLSIRTQIPGKPGDRPNA